MMEREKRERIKVFAVSILEGTVPVVKVDLLELITDLEQAEKALEEKQADIDFAAQKFSSLIKTLDIAMEAIESEAGGFEYKYGKPSPYLAGVLEKIKEGRG